uniref:Ancestral Caspase-6 small subunit n=1 Tax=Homo sapiens TaxID=9606 RepID=UPI001298EA50|nr:Chain B, Ancestral Caspase-6 small subunit [Homo sapiens]6PPM_D Chain D, Ancestral Caspase-6 small subunit [Homo sapiens]6PPM_H Chain H, Ancestral Caspase-6 small subunit [Homo sapiens]6PPM_K Chain K, Ancestral Caspase-6 small subunit [Homo sapiens]
VYTLPAGADFIMCYSTAEGYYSYRETVNGSWYIQDLCEMLKKYGSELEFTEILTLVNRKVSLRSVPNCKDPAAIGKKQMPCFASMLTKKLYFRPK